MKEKQLANWIYWEDNIYYCFGCIQKRMQDINKNQEFSDDIDYEAGETCGYHQDYADDKENVYCCECNKPLYSLIDT